MEASNRKVGLYLTGGLGNQLFQFAAALAVSNGLPIKIFENLGKPRLNARGSADIFSLSIETVTTVLRSDLENSFLSKASGYLLRSAIWPKGIEKFPGFHTSAKSAASVLNYLISKDAQFPVTISNVGYGNIEINAFLSKSLSPYLIGYFQSFVWPDYVEEKLKTLELIEIGDDFTRLKDSASSVPPIILHIRRGDYTNESTFGLPGTYYYKSALDLIDNQFSGQPIWVFSDDEFEARKILDWIPKNRVKYISDVDGSSAASLAAMRLGCAYVIANSSFSWWGAYLSRTQNALIIAPDPWFTGQEEPKLLIPPHWIRLKH